MATYTYQNAIDHVSKYVKGVPTTTIDVVAVDHVDSIIWRFWFWKWSLAALTSISWVDGQQDYTIADASFYRLWRARFTRTDVTPNIIREKNVVQFLSPNKEQSGTIDSITGVSYDYVTGKIRLDKSASVPSGVAVQIDGDFQKTHTKLTATSSSVVFPEIYFDILIEGIKWKYYDLISDSRAGNVQIDKSTHKRVYTGQLGIFYDNLMQMAEAEGMGLGDSNRFPDDPLGSARVTNPGLFAWS